MTEKKRESRYRQTEGTLNEEVRSLRAKLARIEHAKGEHEEWTDIYLALVDNSAQGLAVIENGRIVFANRNMETLTGYSVEKLRAMSAEQVRTLVHPEDQQAVWTRHRGCLSGQDPENPYDFRLIHRNGTVRWLRLHASRINYHGRDAVQAAYVDVTEQKQAEEREAHVKRVLLAIRNVNQLIVAETDRQRLIERACGNLTETLGYFNAWIALLDEGGRVVTMTAASGFDGHFAPMCERLERGDFPACMNEALQNDAIVVVGQPQEDCPDCPLAPAYGDCAGLARRLAFAAKVYGVLVVSVPGPCAHDVEEQGLFKELADDLGFALHRIEAAEALCNSMARYRRFVETALEGIWAMNPQHETTFVNERMASMLGYTPSQMLRRRVEEFMFEEDLPAHRRRMQSRHKGKGGQYEHRFRRADGREVWTLVSATAIMSEQGQFGGSFAMFTDITERKRAIRALERSEQRYRALFEGSPVGIGLATLEGHILITNRAMEELLGYSAQELEHFDIADLYEDLNDRIALLDQVQREGCVSNYPVRLKRKDGCLVDVLLSMSLIQSEDERLLQTMCVDVTEQRHAEQALRESEQKFRAIADYTYDLEIWVGTDGRLVWMNPASERFCGYSDEECATMPGLPLSLIHEGDRARVLSLYEDACQGGSGSDVWFRMIHRNASVIWVSASWQSIRAGDGSSLGWRCSLRDISDRVQAEEELVQNEKKFRALFENMGSGCCIDEVIYKDGEAVDYRILDVNPAYEGIMGIERVRAIGALGSQVYGDGLPPFFDVLVKVAETGEPASFESYFAPVGKYLQCIVSRPAEGRLSTVFTDVTDRMRAQEKLADASRRLREAIRAGNVGLWDWDLATNRVQYSPEWKRQIGYEEDEIGDSFEEWERRVHPDDLTPTLARIKQAIADISTGYYFEFRFRHKDGSYRWILAQSSVFCDQSGRPSRVLGSHVDITEQKLAVERMRLMSETLDTAPSSITVHDFEGRFVYANRKTFEIHGYVEHEFMALNLRQLDAPTSERLIGERMETIAAEGEASFEVEHFRKDGSTFPLEIYVRQVTWEGVPAILSIGTDIGDRKRAQETLGRHRAELQAIYDHAPVMMCVLDPDRRVLYANRAFTEFTGVSEDELTTGRACGVFGCINAQADPRGCGFGPVCERCELRRALDDTLRTGLGHRNVEYRATLERQGNRWDVVLLGATAAIQTDGQSNVLLCLEDRSEQEQAEQRARQRELELLHVARLCTLGEMASGLVHELSQPLSAIVNYSTACVQLGSADRPDWQRIMKNIHKITEQAERARDIMVRIRELAQRRRPRLTSVDVNRVVANVLDLLSWQIRQKGIDLNPDLDDRLPAARADAIQVEQVLVNLTRNAIEAMEQTPPRRRLTIRTSPGDAGTVRIEVSDTGVGIPRDEPDRIFDAFFTTKADGLGIGLSISRTIVEMHEGILQADRNAEGGSTFVVVLPRASKQDGHGPGSRGVGVGSAW